MGRSYGLMVIALMPVIFVAPRYCHAQERSGAAFHFRFEAGLAHLDWWEESGRVYQAGAAWAPSRTSRFAVDVRVSQFVGGDGDGENAVFLGLGPELRVLPSASISPFLSAHLVAGFDGDGGMTAVTGAAGFAVRVWRKGAIRASVFISPDGSWAIPFGIAFGPQ